MTVKIWLIQLGEPLPTDGQVRLYRTGILADRMAEAGHAVTWWAPTFNHPRKRYRDSKDSSVNVRPNYQIQLLHAQAYARNASLARLRYQQSMARKFDRRIREISPPDLILSSFPTPELSAVAVRYARQMNVPIVIDIRDLWPDVFYNFIPGALHSLARLILAGMVRRNRYIFRHATGLIGISPSYLRWGLTLAARSARPTDRVFPLGYVRPSVPSREYDHIKEELARSSIDRTRIICSFVGTFGKSYDLETVIDAARILHGEGDTTVQFVICGDGERAPVLRRRAAGLENVVFLGWVSGHTIRVLLDMSDIGLVTYVRNATQSLPNKPFEYFSAGLPVLSSLRGELSDLVERHDCGLNYEPGEVTSFLTQLRTLSSNTQRRKAMSRNAIALFEHRFSGDSIYAAMVEYLTEIANEYR